MRIIISLILILTTACSVAQPGKIDIGTSKGSAKKAYEEGLRYYDYKQYDLAISSFKKAIEKDDAFIGARMALGACYMDLEDYGNALAEFKKCIELNPKYNVPYYYGAMMHFYLENYADCRDLLEKYKILNPKMGLERKDDIETMLTNCTFAEKAVANPVDFNPINMGPNVNSEYNEYFPAITVDGSTFIFTRRIGQNEDFFISKNVDSVWGKAYNIGRPINTPLNEGAQTISSDGRFIFYTACNRTFGMGKCDIYVSRFEGDHWSEPENLGAPINTTHWESQPSISSDGKTIYFISARPGGYGGLDIWASTYGADGWGEPYNLGPNVNTSKDEQSPFIHPDNQTLYFSSNGWPGMGNADIYYTRLGADGKWQKATNMGYPINTPADESSLVVDRLGRIAYYASDKLEGYGGLDFYMFELPEVARPKELSYVKGTIYDAVTKERLRAAVELIDLETGKTVVSTVSNSDGTFLVILQGNKDYALNVNKKTYLFHSENFSLTQTTSTDPYNIDVYLQKIGVDNKIVMRNVFFASGKYDLKSESKTELDKLVAFMKNNPNISIEIGGHTDDVGNDEDNRILSQNRANSVMQYLIDAGIEKERLTAKGYGESQPEASNLTEEGRALNRRTEIKITKQ